MLTFSCLTDEGPQKNANHRGKQGASQHKRGFPMPQLTRDVMQKKNQRTGRTFPATVKRWLALGIFSTFIVPSLVLAADPARRIAFNIPSRPLAQALADFSRQSDVIVVAASELVKGKVSKALNVTTTAEEALKQLMEGSKLIYTQEQDGSIIVKQAVTESAPTSDTAASADAAKAATVPEHAERRFEQPVIQEVIVTAEKRAERLQDVPVPVSAISASDLTQNNKTRLDDYFSEVPGLTYWGDGFFGIPTIRGLSTGAGVLNPTVAFSVDDVPFGAATANGGSYFVPELDANDLERIEVLRGPQGALYGGNSIGGLIKYVTVDPSTAAFSWSGQAGISNVSNGDGASYNVSGAVNVPLRDTVAVRASAYTHSNAGFIDNPVLNLRGVNSKQTTGSRVSALWSPSEQLAVKLGVIYQRFEQDGQDQVQFRIPLFPGSPVRGSYQRGTPLGDLEQDMILGAGRRTTELWAYSANIHGTLGAADLTSITGYLQREMFDSSQFVDFSPVYEPTTVRAFGVAPGSTGNITQRDYTFRKFSQELRLVVPLAERIEWLLGAFYTEESGPHAINTLAAYPDTGVIVGNNYAVLLEAPYTETAVFTNITVHFTPQFDVQVGGRGTRIRAEYGRVEGGPLITFRGITPPLVSRSVLEDDNFTYLFTPRYKFSQHLMAYIRIASGFRPGAPNPGTLVEALQEVAPDKTKNYEIGFKADAFDSRLSVDTSVYYIDWEAVQLQAVSTGVPYLFNGRGARSQGIELAVQVRPSDGLNISGWVALNDAVFTEPLPATSIHRAAKGDRLPGGARVSAHLSAEQEFYLGRELTGSVGASINYLGDRMGNLTPTPPRQVYDAYTTADVHVGVRYNQWSARLFATNITDRRALIAGGLGIAPFISAFGINPPRLIGLNFSKSH